MVTNVQIYNNHICDASDSMMHGASEEASAAQPTETEVAEGAKSAPTERVPMLPMNTEYKQHSEMTIADDDGNVVVAQVITPENSDGKIEVYSEAPLWGENFNYLTAEELDSMQRTAHNMDASAEEETAPETESEGTETSGEVGVESEERNISSLKWSEEKAQNGEPFLVGEGNSIDMVDIPQDVFVKMGISPMPFRLTPSMVNHVLQRHAKELKLANAQDAVNAILEIMRNFDHVRKGRDNTYVFTMEAGRTRAARRAITLVLEHDNGGWLG